MLTLDDAVKSHRTFAGPLLKELGFGATFFVTHRWMDDAANFMTWRDIAELYQMGFEVGNHTWTHANFSSPREGARLEGELALVENELRKVDVPKPVSFAWPGNQFGPEAMAVIRRTGFRFARRGLMPETPYGAIEPGPVFDPQRHHPLLIPTTGDAYPKWTMEHFDRVLALAKEGRAVVLQFHGVPDVAHPWVHTPAEAFRDYMLRLKQGGFRVLALRELGPYIDTGRPPADPLLTARVPSPKGEPPLPDEVAATRESLDEWFAVMRRHRYSAAEAAVVGGMEEREAGKRLSVVSAAQGAVLPYPGGRHFRIGFLEGAIDPMRGTKASVFLPWDSQAYAVVDLPEAIFAGRELLFLAHTHVPTIWNDRNEVIRNTDWRGTEGGGLRSEWKLPNGIRFGASVKPEAGYVALECWVENGTREPLRNLRAQVCVGLKGVPEMSAQTNDNKRLEKLVAAVRSADGKRWLSTAWENTARVWGNPACPCLHADPSLPDCAPGETVRTTGRLWFGPPESRPV